MSLPRVNELGNHVFAKGPAHLPWMVHIQVTSSNFDVLSHKGALTRLSPEDGVRSTVLRCAAHLQEHQEEKDPVALKWREVLLSVTYCFELVGQQEAAYWRAQALRQQVSADFVAMKRTARQMCHELALFRKMQEDTYGRVMTAKEVAQEYMTHSRRVKGQDQDMEFSQGFVEAALKLYEVACQDADLSAMITAMELKYGLGSCFNSVTRLSQIVQRCEDADARMWVFAGIVDAVEDKRIRNEARDMGL